LAVKTASEMTYTVSGGALNSAQPQRHSLVFVITHYRDICLRVHKTLVFLKAQPTGFWVFLVFQFYLNEQLVSLLFDLAHQLSFYLDSSVL